jgi:uncharacterized metal-binding protein
MLTVINYLIITQRQWQLYYKKFKLMGLPKSSLHFKIKNPGHKKTCNPSPEEEF